MTQQVSAIPQSEPFKLTAACDVGTSGGKFLAAFEVGEYPFPHQERFFLVPPPVRSLTPQTYASRLEDLEMGEGGLEASLLSYVDPLTDERVYWELGATATRPGFLAVSERKFQKCLAKILNFLGYLVSHEMRILSDAVAVRLGVLLPFDEFGDRQLLADWLRKAVMDFEFNGQRIRNIELKSVNIRPEGFGIYKAYGSDHVLIVGHSDSTWLCFMDNCLNTKLSKTLPETGMHDFLRSVDFPITYELRAAQLIASAGAKLQSKALLQLTQTRSETEVEQLRQALLSARRQYWSDRQAQFALLNLGGGMEVAVSGGTALYFANELNAVFKEQFGIRLNWCQELTEEFQERFEVGKQPDLLHRFADCYGFYRTLPWVSKFAAQIKTVEIVGGSTHV